MDINICVAGEQHLKYASHICDVMADAAQKRGTGIARRSPEYIEQKMLEGKAVIALQNDQFAGFCYIESWGHNKFVANSGLIVIEEFRNSGLAKKIKAKVFELSQKKYPGAKIFGITTSHAVMKINSDLGYKPVPFSELTDDDNFWKGCQGCVNYDILQRTSRKHCLCTGMLYDPNNKPVNTEVQKKSRWQKFQEFLKLGSSRLNPKKDNKKKNNDPNKLLTL